MVAWVPTQNASRVEWGGVPLPYVSTILSVSTEMVQICISSFKRTTLWNCPKGQYSPPRASVRAKVKISNVYFLRWSTDKLSHCFVFSNLNMTKLNWITNRFFTFHISILQSSMDLMDSIVLIICTTTSQELNRSRSSSQPIYWTQWSGILWTTSSKGLSYLDM